MCYFLPSVLAVLRTKNINYCDIAFSENGLLLCHIYGYVLAICLPNEVH